MSDRTDKDTDKFVMIKYVMRSDLDLYIKKFNENHLLMYVTIQRYTGMRSEINFTLSWIYEDLNIVNTDLRYNLKQSLFDLMEWELVEPLKKLDIDKVNKNTKIELKSVSLEGNFKQIYDSEIEQILNSKNDIRAKKTMLFLFISIVSRIDRKNYCYPSFIGLKKDLQTTSDATITDNLVRLKELKLIDYDNPGTIIDQAGAIKQGNNIYVRCSTKDYKTILNTQVKKRTSDLVGHKNQVIKDKQANHKRSKTMTEIWKQRKGIEEVEPIEDIDQVEETKATNTIDDDIEVVTDDIGGAKDDDKMDKLLDNISVSNQGMTYAEAQSNKRKREREDNPF